MSFGIQIEVSPGNALSTISSVEGALGKVEQAAPKAGAAISTALGTGSAAADRAKQSTQSLAEQFAAMTNAAAPFKAITEAMQRETDMLGQIRGPMQQYMKDLETLDAMLSKGAISTSEYASQVTKMNAKIGERPTVAAAPEKAEGLIGGSFAQAIGGQFGEAGSLLGGLASKGAMEAGALVGLGTELIHLGDEYSALQNKALEFGGSLGTVDQAIQSQLDLSGQLHSSLDETMELSIAVKERADDLGLSLQQQGQFAQAFGQAVELSGGSIQSASQAFTEFTLALESGQGAGRYMKTIMAEYPELAEALEHGLGKTTQQLIDLGNRGALTPKMIGEAMIQQAGELQTKYGQVNETISQASGHLWDRFKVDSGQALSAVSHSVASFLDPETLERQANAAVEAQQEAWSKAKPVWDQLQAVHGSILDFDDLSAAIQRTGVTAEQTHLVPPDYETGGKKLLDDTILKYKLFEDQIKQTNIALNNASSNRHDANYLPAQGQTELERHAQDLNTQSINGNYSYGALANQITQAEESRKRGRADLLAALHDYQTSKGGIGISPTEYSDEIKKYQEPLSEYAQWLKSTLAPQAEYTKQVHFLAAAHDAGRISAGLYAEELRKTQTTYETWLEKTNQKMPSVAGAGLGITGPSANDLSVGSIQIDNPNAGAAQSLVEKYSGITSQVEQYRKAQIELNDAVHEQVLSAPQAAAMLDQVRAQILGTSDATDKFSAELTKDKALLDAGLMSATGYAAAVKKIGEEQLQSRLQSGQGSVADSFHEQFDKMAKDGGNAGQVMASTFGSAVNEMNTALEGLVTGANVSWSSIGQSFEKMIVDMSMKLVESQIFKWLGGALAGSSTGSAMYAGSDASAVGSAGASIGGSILGALGGAGTILGGLFANGGDVAIPHAANGYSGRIGGYGGTDSKLFAAMVTPGEHVAIRTPEQMSAASRASAQPVQVHVVMPDNKRALLKTAASADGQRQVINTMQRNKSALRGLLK